jgi:hypothetical protein
MKLSTFLFWVAEYRLSGAIFFGVVFFSLFLLSFILAYFKNRKKTEKWDKYIQLQKEPHGDDMLHFFQAVNDPSETSNKEVGDGSNGDNNDSNDVYNAIVLDATFDSCTGIIKCSKTKDFSSLKQKKLTQPIMLAIKAGQLFGGMDIGMGTCAHDSWFRSFWLQCYGDVMDTIDRSHIQYAFGNSINDQSIIAIEPFIRGGGKWWEEVLLDCRGSLEEGNLLKKWDQLILWFQETFPGKAYFVRIDPINNVTGYTERPRLVVGRCDGAIVGFIGCVLKKN